jgi:creatinine amidohydrolase
MQLALSTWHEVEDYLRGGRGVIVPIGSTEQHGPNGLIGTDYLDADCVARAVGDRTGAMVAPPLCYGMSQHHLGFAGSVTLRPSTLIAVVNDVVRSLARHGFERFLFINGHGGNVATVNAAFDELYAVTSMDHERGGEGSALRCLMVFWSGGPRCTALARELYGDSNGSHATAAEVALAQFCQPEHIKHAQMSPKVAPRSNGFHDSADYRRRYPDGRIGSDPSLSTPEQGRQLFEAAVADMAELYQRFTTE